MSLKNNNNKNEEEEEEDFLDYLVINAKDFCLLNGLVMFDKLHIKNENDMFKNYKCIHSPVTLMPSIYPRSEFEYAFNLQNSFNQLIFSVSNDYEFLKESLKKYILLILLLFVLFLVTHISLCDYSF
jgi:hypothetical protein